MTFMSGLDLSIWPSQWGEVFQGLVWVVGDWLTFYQYEAQQTNASTH